jgi:hypothetical protein
MSMCANSCCNFGGQKYGKERCQEDFKI